MKRVVGDLVEMAKNGDFDVVIHGANAWCVMGGGFAKSIRMAFPECYEADLKTGKGDRSKMGTYSRADIGDFTIVNAYTQYMYGNDGIRHVDYDAVQKVFELIKKDFHGKKIAYPMIGAGLAGGDWEVLSGIIDVALSGEDHTLVVLP